MIDVVFIPSGEIISVSKKGIDTVIKIDNNLKLKNPDIIYRPDLVSMVWDFNSEVWYVNDKKRDLFYNRVVRY